MRRLALALLLLPSAALAQSAPNWPQDYIPGVGEWHDTFAGKADMGTVAGKADASDLGTASVTVNGASATLRALLSGQAPIGGLALTGRIASGGTSNYFGPMSGGNPQNWLAQYAYGDAASVVGLSPVGGVGLTGASRNTDNNGAASAAIGTVGFNFNYNLNAPAGGWGGYFETRHRDGAGVSQGVEIDATEFGTALVPTSTVPAFSTAGLWLVAGGGCTAANPCWNGVSLSGVANDASLALGISTNSAKFRKGILFRSNALTGCDGITAGLACTAVEMGRGHQLVWDDPAGGARALLSSDMSVDGPVTKLKFTDNGLMVQNYNGKQTFQVAVQSSDVNGVIVTGATSGNRAIISPTEPGTGLLISGNGSTSPGVQIGQILGLPSYTVAGLPSCDMSRQHFMAAVTDASNPAYNQIVSGGGAAHVPVFCDGANWSAH